jgi:hypothetical protein
MRDRKTCRRDAGSTLERHHETPLNRYDAGSRYAVHDPSSVAVLLPRLLNLLRNNSLKRGDFILSSGAKSDIYFDCKLTILDSYGIWKVGEVMLDLIRRSAMDRGVTIDSVGGLTMGADSISQAVGMLSVKNGTAIQFF